MQFDLQSLKDILAYDPQSPLLFNTGLFMLLFVALLGVYALVRGHRKARMALIIAFSLYFYYKSSAAYCFILLGVCVSDYVLGRLMPLSPHRAVRKAIIWLNVLINVGMLVYFKYFNLLWETFANMTSQRFDPLDIVLPAGISFFTFRSISYLVDIYRGHIEPARNFLDYCFFLSFFPPLLAGPVVRARDMLPAISENPVATRAMVGEGLFLIISGLVKKVIVADYISGNFVDRIFDNPSLYSGFENVMGIFGFTLQLYCDFSGYSDMAIGLALLLGFRFKDNFNAPFKAQSPTEFWHRWHISLSTWLRDYVYIPLGGSRCSAHRSRANLITTMAVGGLWHGASWMYVIWGFYNGILLVGHKELAKRWHTAERLRDTWVVRTVNVLITFTLISIGFAIFRANSMGQLGEMATQVFTNFHIEVAPQFVAGYLLIVLAIAFGYAMHFAPRSLTQRTRNAYIALPEAVQAVILAAVLFLVIQTRQSDIVPFIYLQY